MLATWLIDPLMCGIYVGLHKGQFFYVITLGQHAIHRRTRVINVPYSRNTFIPGINSVLLE